MTSPFLRFLASGVANTAVTYVLYALLLMVMPYRWAYSLAFAAGIALAYVLYRFFVFRTSAGRSGLFWVITIYAAQYLMGLGLVTLWTDLLGLPDLLAPAFAVAITLPLTFVLNRLVFKRQS